MDEDSILLSIKKLIGINVNDNEFDMDLKIHINSVFSTLYQIGVGKKDHYSISSKDDTWSDIFKDYPDLIDYIKQYTYMKCRMVFDPPTSSTLSASLNEEIAELVWRIQIQAEYPDHFDIVDAI